LRVKGPGELVGKDELVARARPNTIVEESNTIHDEFADSKYRPLSAAQGDGGGRLPRA
jgi:hypothetical protein